MSLSNVPAGKDVPNDFNVIIEIPMRGEPIKFEVDKESGAIFVDRFMGTAIRDDVRDFAVQQARHFVERKLLPGKRTLDSRAS